MWPLPAAGNERSTAAARLAGAPADPQPRARIVAARRTAQAAIRLDRGGGTPADIRAHEADRGGDESLEILPREHPGRHKRIHPSGEQHLGLVDVADSSDRRLIEQRI